MKKWYVVYTKPRWEKKVIEELTKIEIEAYCPMITEVHQWSDRKKKVTVPLIKSYVFIFIEDANRDKVFAVTGILRYLHWLKKPAIIKNSEIDTLKNWIDNPEAANISVSHLSPGDGLLIANGSFKGHEAIVSKVGKKRLKLILKSLNLVVSVKLKDAIL